MNPNETEHPLLQTLARLETDPDLDEDEGRRLAARLHLEESLHLLSVEIREEHLDLTALRGLAAEHRRKTGEKNPPEHLTTCPICLNLFECLLDGIPEVAPRTIRRFEHLSKPASWWTRQGWFSSKPGLLRVAAIVVILVGAGVLSRPLFFANPPVTETGGFTLANGAAVPAGERVPSGQPFTMDAGAALALKEDGTSVRAECASEMSFSRSFLKGDPQFEVHGGDVWVTAAKQKSGSSIVVQTPLGHIRVVGTAFRVTLKSEPVVVYENRPKVSEIKKYDTFVSAVVVAVQEGTVALQNQHEQVAVTAGQTAIMRKGQPRIEVP